MNTCGLIKNTSTLRTISSLGYRICGKTRDRVDQIFTIDDLRKLSKTTGRLLIDLILEKVRQGKLPALEARWSLFTEAECVEIYHSLSLEKRLTEDLWGLYRAAFDILLTVEKPDETLTKESDYFKFLTKHLRRDCPFFKEIGEELLHFLILWVEDNEWVKLAFSLWEALWWKPLKTLVAQELSVRDVDSEDLKALWN